MKVGENFEREMVIAVVNFFFIFNSLQGVHVKKKKKKRQVLAGKTNLNMHILVITKSHITLFYFIFLKNTQSIACGLNMEIMKNYFYIYATPCRL